MTHVVVERAELDHGRPVLYRDGGQRIRMAYDPAQITEAEALLLTALGLQRPLGGMHVRYAAEP